MWFKPDTSPPHNFDGSASHVTTSHRERDSDYERVLVQLSNGLRVIACKDNTQFILQRKFAEGLHAVAWRPLGYFTCRKALIVACVKRHGPLGPNLLAQLHHLPQRASLLSTN